MKTDCWSSACSPCLHVQEGSENDFRPNMWLVERDKSVILTKV